MFVESAIIYNILQSLDNSNRTRKTLKSSIITFTLLLGIIPIPIVIEQTLFTINPSFGNSSGRIMP
jgi:hypothetical protein